jgi:hypothetical protein
VSDIWKSWTEVKKICAGKKVVLFGRSDDWVPKTILKLEYVKEKYIVDSNPAYTGSPLKGLTVYLPDKLHEENKGDFYIIITAGPYQSVVDQLVEMGFTPGVDFCCTPEIKDWGLLQEIREYEQNIIVACSDYSEKGKKRYSSMGGGIYVCNTLKSDLEKVIPGHFRQLTRVEDKIYVVEFVEKKIYVLSDKLEVLKILDIERPGSGEREKPNACGIAYHPGKQWIFVANAGSDTINIYDRKDFNLLHKIHFSGKFNLIGDGQHHINDICIAEDTLYVSYFSLSGNWKRGILDGGISEFDVNNITGGSTPVVSGLWMPHSVEYLEGNLCYVNSMRGELYIGNQKYDGKFPGLMRGLAFDDRFYYVGQSEDMYMSRLFGVSDNIMVNAGVYLFDVSTKVSRFYSFPFIMNVHDILILD